MKHRLHLPSRKGLKRYLRGGGRSAHRIADNQFYRHTRGHSARRGLR